MEVNDVNGMQVQEESAFLTAPFKGKNSFWRYFTGSVTPFIVSNLIGAIPLAVVIIAYAGDGVMPARGGMPDFEAMGINLNFGFFLTVFPFVLAFFTLALLIKPLNDRSFGTVINGGKKIRWGRIFFSAAVWTAVAALWLFYSMRTDPGSYVLNNTSTSLITLAILALTMIPLQAGFEEILFRGYLIQGFAFFSHNRWLPIVVTSVLFGLMHGLNPEVKEYGFFIMMPQYIFFGLVFAVLTMMDDGIELAIGAHAANNAFLSVFITNKDSALQTSSIYEQLEYDPIMEFGGLVAMSLLFIAIMAIVYKWKDIRKLYGRINVPQEGKFIGDQIP
jgi:membrane protease YdiL (CAAX protease family)